MTFIERNAAWNGDARSFIQHHSRSGTPRVWHIRVEGNAIHTTWGQLNGAMQNAVERKEGINEGKKNAKSGALYALERARDMCRKKHWEGYREFNLATGQLLDPMVETNINFDELPLSLSFYKPDNTMGAGITKKAEAGKVLYARKANGMMFVIAKGSGPAKLYSRRMLRSHDDEAGQEDKTWDRRFSSIRGVADLLMPPNSILLGELVMMHSQTGQESFKHAQSVTKSLTDRVFTDLAIAANECYWPAFYAWDVAFWDGQDLVRNAPVRERYELLHEVLEGPHLIPVQYFDASVFPTPQAAQDYAKAQGWEGFVVVDPDGIYGDKAYNFKGKPDRPGSVCAKLKPEFEDDFVAIWNPEWPLKSLTAFAGGADRLVLPDGENGTIGERSTKDRYKQGIKSVALFQYDRFGRLHYISNVSSGLEESMKTDWAKPDLYPQVWKVAYKGRRYMSQGDDTNALDFAAFVEVRTDKRPEECVNPEL